MTSTNEASGMESQIFDIAGLAPGNCGTPTGMRDEIILLSWLIVLMRTQESSAVSFEWQYQGSEEVLGSADAVRTLSPNDVMIGLQSHLGQAAAMLAGTIPSITQTQQSELAIRPSLRLSNASLSQSSDDATEEVSLTQRLHMCIYADRFKQGPRPSGVTTC
jgi:hypothetical protein